jgi:hypothetical protein
MNYYFKIGGFVILGYLCFWLLFMISMSLKLYFDKYGYPSFNSFMKLFYNL